MLHTVKRVEYLGEFKLKLHFDDRKVKVVDLERMIGQAKNRFFPLRNPVYFKQVKCDGITIRWPNGVDLCPDVLYTMGREPTRTTKRKNTLRRRRVVRRL